MSTSSAAYFCIGGPLNGHWIHADDFYSEIKYDNAEVSEVYRRLVVGYSSEHTITVFVHSGVSDKDACKSIKVVGKPVERVH